MNRPALPASMAALACLAALASSGCLTAAARLRAGPTVDTRGQVGYEIGVSAGFGIATSEARGVRSMPGFATSDRAGAALTETAELGGVERDLVWAAGITGELVSSSDDQATWLFGAALAPLAGASRRDRGHEKMGFGGTSRWALSAGLEARAGFAVQASPESRDHRGIFALLPAIDLTMISTLDL